MKRFVWVLTGVLMLGVVSQAFAETVYVTKKGKKYHKAACVLIQKSELTEIDDSQAREQGRTACKKCFSETSEGQ